MNDKGRKKIPIALTIAGSDSGGGAGIQADLKSFSANGAYGASVITALTAQNTQGVSAIFEPPADFITAQLDAVFEDLEIDAVKIGMLANSEVITAIAASLEKYQPRHIVLDPVMVTTSGDPLIADEAVETLRKKLFPLASLVTPNLFEAARLSGGKMAQNTNEMKGQGRGILANGAKAVLIKGGHSYEVDGKESDECADVLITSSSETWFSAPRIKTDNTHGTGCSLSSAIAANLAKGLEPDEAINEAKNWLTGAIEQSGELNIGKGAGPVHHFHQLWA